jgi:hypothetical protein
MNATVVPVEVVSRRAIGKLASRGIDSLGIALRVGENTPSVSSSLLP